MIKAKIIKIIKRIFGVKNLTLTIRRKQQDIQKIFYRKKYSADDIISMLKESGMQPGHPLILHTAMHNFYNYTGTADELIDKLIDFLGEDGTLCMCAFPNDKYNTQQVFDVSNTPSAAGYLTELFRKRPGVKRSLNQLHSVCAIGKDADYIVGDHHNSRICFDEHSPFYRIAELHGYSVSLGMPKWYIGTCEHVCEALLYEKFKFFQNRFSREYEFTYVDFAGNELKHTMLTKTVTPYVRKHTTGFVDQSFDKGRYSRKKLSNIWVTVFDACYLVEQLQVLANKGITIYKTPKFLK